MEGSFILNLSYSEMTTLIHSLNTTNITLFKRALSKEAQFPLAEEKEARRAKDLLIKISRIRSHGK